MLCPKCDSLMVARIRNAGPLDAVFGLLSLASFECQACRHRFRAKPPETRAVRGTDERRKAARLPVRIPVNFECGDVAGEGTLTDLS
jgi:DNA-directed RNA polymerase subunit M/transcription elongation factor TFIIS